MVRFGGRIEDVGYILTHRGGRILVRGMVGASVRRSGVDLWFGLRFGSGVASGFGAVKRSRIGGRCGDLLLNLFDTVEILILIVKRAVFWIKLVLNNKPTGRRRDRSRSSNLGTPGGDPL